MTTRGRSQISCHLLTNHCNHTRAASPVVIVTKATNCDQDDDEGDDHKLLYSSVCMIDVLIAQLYGKECE